MDKPIIMLVTIGFGGSTCWIKPTGNDRSRIESYDRDGWRKYLAPDADHEIPADTPVVDCTVEGCDTFAWATKGPMFASHLPANEFSEFLRKPEPWTGQRLSGMAEVGLAGYLVHALSYGCSITYAHTGEPFPLTGTEITGDPDARNNLIALGVAVDPSATIAAVMLDRLMEGSEDE
jgi:hypothetical protein